VLDNEGRLLFETRLVSKPFRQEAIGFSNGQLYIKRSTPNGQVISLLDKLGNATSTVKTQPLEELQIWGGRDLLAAYGRPIWSSGRSMPKLKVYSLSSGQLRLEVPVASWRSFAVLEQASWQLFWVIDAKEEGDGLWARGFDGEMSERGSVVLHDHACDLELALPYGEQGIIGVTKDKSGDGQPQRVLFAFRFDNQELKSRRLEMSSEAPIVQGSMLGGNLLLWNWHDVVLLDLKTLETIWTVTAPDANGHRLESGVVAEGGGAFALISNCRYRKRAARVFVYTRSGALASSTELRPGVVNNVKFTSGRRDILVFANDYTARLPLDEESFTQTGVGASGESLPLQSTVESEGRPPRRPLPSSNGTATDVVRGRAAEEHPTVPTARPSSMVAAGEMRGASADHPISGKTPAVAAMPEKSQEPSSSEGPGWTHLAVGVAAAVLAVGATAVALVLRRRMREDGER
jgi:hypothetical protein